MPGECTGVEGLGLVDSGTPASVPTPEVSMPPPSLQPRQQSLTRACSPTTCLFVPGPVRKIEDCKGGSPSSYTP